MLKQLLIYHVASYHLEDGCIICVETLHHLYKTGLILCKQNGSTICLVSHCFHTVSLYSHLYKEISYLPLIVLLKQVNPASKERNLLTALSPHARGYVHTVKEKFSLGLMHDITCPLALCFVHVGS